MHTIIHRPQLKRFPALSLSNGSAAKPTPGLRSPHYECTDLPQALKLTVYVPGVNAAGIELLTQNTDLVLTARKPHYVRPNWTALHLEPVQRDYVLRLRLGAGYDFEQLHASITKGVLTIVLPKRGMVIATPSAPQRQVA